MPRLMSPMIRRRPLPPLRDEEPPRNQESPAPGQEPPAFEEPEESSRVVAGTYRQIRDYSLVLLSQGIVHRYLRSDEGPFEIFVAPEFEERAREQLDLYCKENPPKEENPPLPLSLRPWSTLRWSRGCSPRWTAWPAASLYSMYWGMPISAGSGSG